MNPRIALLTLASLLVTTPAIARKKPKPLQVEYQAYSGAALPADKVATIYSRYPIGLDSRDLRVMWDSSSLRPDCKHVEHKGNPEVECLATKLKITTLPGKHILTWGIQAVGGKTFNLKAGSTYEFTVDHVMLSQGNLHALVPVLDLVERTNVDDSLPLGMDDK